MKRMHFAGAALAVLAIGGLTIWVASGALRPGGMSGANSRAPVAMESEAARPADAKLAGKVLGNFDPAMSGVCQFSCAIQAKYDPADVVLQPGAADQQITQCPVSGVVFVVDSGRPHVRFDSDEYVTCCDGCAEKLRKNPGRYVKV